MGKRGEAITEEQAEAELESIMGYRYVDRLAFARAHFCMRVLGVPVSDGGRPIVVEDQPGDEARDMWAAYEDVMDRLRERHDDWLELQEFGE